MKHKLHYSKANNFVLWAIMRKDYVALDTIDKYEVFRIKKDGKTIVGYGLSKNDYITVFNEGIKLVDEYLRSTK